MDLLIREYERVRNSGFELDFVYPTKAERERMRIVNRDMSEAQKSNLTRTQKNISDLIQGLEKGQIFIEDFKEDQIERLRTLLNKGERNGG